MGFPWEFTMPVPGPWQERQSSAARIGVALIDQMTTRRNAKYIPVRRGLFPLMPLWRGVRWVLLGVVTVGLFARSNWGKMRMF